MAKCARMGAPLSVCVCASICVGYLCAGVRHLCHLCEWELSLSLPLSLSLWVNSAGVLPAFRLYLRADARLEKGAEFFFPAHFLAAATAAHPPTTQSPPPATQPSSHPPSPTYLVRLSALPRQIILKRLWGGRGKWSKKFKSVGKKVGKTSRVHFHVQFFSLSLSHSLSLSGSRPLYRAWQIVAILDF